MGLATATLTLENPKLPALSRLKVQALADSGAVFLCVPEHVAEELQLKELCQKEVELANGRGELKPYVGPIHVRFDNRECMVGGIVKGKTVLLGAIPMEDMDLVIEPRKRKVMVNPAYPHYAHGLAVGVRPSSAKKRKRK